MRMRTQNFQCARRYYLRNCRRSWISESYMSQIESLRRLTIFGRLLAKVNFSWAQWLGMRFGSEGDQSLRSLEGPCSSSEQCNANLSY